MLELYIHEKGVPNARQKIWSETEVVAPGSIPPGAIQEGKKYVLELTGISSPTQAKLSILRETVEQLYSEDRSTARWSWEPGFHGGEIEVTFDPGTGQPVTTRVVTDPDVRKLTRGQFHHMVRDILTDTFALFRLSGFQEGVGRGSGSQAPPIARLEFLRSRMEDIEDVVREVVANPTRVLRSEEESIRAHKASGARGTEINRSFRTGKIRRETRSPGQLPEKFRGYFPERIRKTVKTTGLDIREHQDMKSSLAAWAGWLQATGERLKQDSRSAEDPRYREGQRCRRLAARLIRLRDLPFFDGVTDRTSPIQLTSLYRNSTAYRRFFRIHQDISLGIARITGDFLDIPLARTFDLYEVWCFLRLIRAASRYITGGDTDPSAIFEFDPATQSITVSASAEEVPLGNGLALHFKREYREYWLSDSGQGSFSRSMIPDLSLSYTEPQGPQCSPSLGASAGDDPEMATEGSASRLIVLDAKYRIDSGLNEAVASIHMYRDALVECGGDHTSRIVAGAYLLSPLAKAEQTDASWRDTGMPDRLFHPRYRGAFRFGALQMRPGMTLEEIYRALTAALDDSGVSVGSM